MLIGAPGPEIAENAPELSHDPSLADAIYLGKNNRAVLGCAHMVKCPRCGNHEAIYHQAGSFVSFCEDRLAFLRPHEFSPEDLAELKEQDIPKKHVPEQGHESD